MPYLFNHSLMKHGQDCWKAFLIVPGFLCVLDEGICFAAFQWCSVVLFVKAVPCPVDAANGSPLWKFAHCNTAASLLVKPVPDFNQVKLLPREWLSPFTFCVQTGGLPSSWQEAGVCRESGPMVPFLTGAAQQAFWTLPVASLKKLAFQQYKLVLTGTDVDILATLIFHILKCDDLELANILELRCVCHSVVVYIVCVRVDA